MNRYTKEVCSDTLGYLLNARSVIENHLEGISEMMQAISSMSETEAQANLELIKEVHEIAGRFYRKSAWSGFEEVNSLYDIYELTDKFKKTEGVSRYAEKTEDDGYND